MSRRYTPKSRREFWLPKFARNVARDRKVTRVLRKAGWKVLRVWECELARKESGVRFARRIARALPEALEVSESGFGLAAKGTIRSSTRA